MNNFEEKLYNYIRLSAEPVGLGDICKSTEFGSAGRKNISSALISLGEQGILYRKITDGKAYYSTQQIENSELCNPVKRKKLNISGSNKPVAETAPVPTIPAVEQSQQISTPPTVAAAPTVEPVVSTAPPVQKSEISIFNYAPTYYQEKKYSGNGYEFAIPDDFEIRENHRGKDFVAWLPDSTAPEDYTKSNIVFYANGRVPYKSSFNTPNGIFEVKIPEVLTCITNVCDAESMKDVEICPLQCGDNLCSCNYKYNDSGAVYSVGEFMKETAQIFRFAIKGVSKSDHEKILSLIKLLMRGFSTAEKPFVPLSQLDGDEFIGPPLSDSQKLLWKNLFTQYMMHIALYKKFMLVGFKTKQDRLKQANLYSADDCRATAEKLLLEQDSFIGSVFSSTSEFALSYSDAYSTTEDNYIELFGMVKSALESNKTLSLSYDDVTVSRPLSIYECVISDWNVDESALQEKQVNFQAIKSTNINIQPSVQQPQFQYQSIQQPSIQQPSNQPTTTSFTAQSVAPIQRDTQATTSFMANAVAPIPRDTQAKTSFMANAVAPVQQAPQKKVSSFIARNFGQAQNAVPQQNAPQPEVSRPNPDKPMSSFAMKNFGQAQNAPQQNIPQPEVSRPNPDKPMSSFAQKNFYQPQNFANTPTQNPTTPPPTVPNPETPSMFAERNFYRNSADISDYISSDEVSAKRREYVELPSKIARLKREAASKENELKSIIIERERLFSQRTDLQKIFNEKSENLKSAEAEHYRKFGDTEKIREAELTRITNTITALKERRVTASNELASLGVLAVGRKRELKELIQETDKNLEIANTELTTVQSNLGALKESGINDPVLAVARNEFNIAQQELDKVRSAVESIMNQEQTCRNNLAELNSEISQKEARLNQLRGELTDV